MILLPAIGALAAISMAEVTIRRGGGDLLHGPASEQVSCSCSGMGGGHAGGARPLHVLYGRRRYPCALDRALRREHLPVVSTLAHLLVDLMSTAPGLVPIYREHLALHDALLPEVFMAQITEWLSGTRHAASVGAIPGGAGGDEARTVVGVIETHLTSGDAEVRELISLSFLSSIDASPANEVLRLHFGPSLRAEAARRDGWLDD